MKRRRKVHRKKAAQSHRSLRPRGSLKNTARLTRERDEALEQQAATSEVLSIIRRSPTDAQPVFDAIVESAARLCGAIFSISYLYDGDHLRVAATKGFTPAATRVVQHNQRKPQRSHLGGRAILDRAVVHVADVLADPEYSREYALAGGWRAVLAVPLLRDGIPLGALSVAKAEATPFSDRQIQLLKTFADQAVIAIENTRLLNELRESLQQQTATADVLKVISRSTFDLKTVLNTLVESSASLCDAYDSSIHQPDGERLLLLAHYGPISVESVGSLPLIRGTVAGRTFLDARTIHIADVQREVKEYPESSANARRLGFRAILSVPLMREGVAIGVIGLRRTEPQLFTERQVALLQTFADQAVIAIENVRLFDEVQTRTRELSEALDQQTATSDVLRVISISPTDVNPIFKAMLESASRLCNSEEAAVFRFDGELLHLAATENWPAETAATYASRYPMQPNPHLTVGRVVLTKSVVIQEDTLADANYEHALARAGGWRRMVGVPMLHDGNVIGVIVLAWNEPGPVLPRYVELLRTFASQAVIAIENVRLFNELRESLQQQTATADVLKVISRSTFDLQKVLDTLTESAARLCEADRASVTLKNDSVYRHGSSYGLSPEAEQYAQEHPIPIDRGTVTGRVASEGRAIHIVDVLADPEYTAVGFQKAFGYRTNLGIPLLREGTVIGVFSLQRDEVNPFTDKQIGLAQTFADQAVIAIENVRLFEEVEARTRELSESLEQQTATSEVLQVISSSQGHLEPVFNAMLGNATRICEAKFGVLLLYEGDAFRVTALHNAPPAYAEERRRDPRIGIPQGTALARVVETRQTVQIADIQSEPAYSSDPQRRAGIMGSAGARTQIMVPMLKDEKLIGAIAIFRQEVRPFSAKQIELVTSFASQAVIAIENARLLSELHESLQQQTATAEVLKIISRSTFDLQTVLQTLVDAAARLCGADQALIMRPGEHEHSFYAAASYGHSAESIDYLGTITFMPGREGVVGRVLLERKPVQIVDVLSDPDFRFHEIQRLGNFRTLLGLPLLREGRPIGILAVSRSKVQPFDDKHIELLTSFADQAVIAIENVRLFESVEARTREVAKSLEDLRTTQDRLVQTQKLALLGQLTAGIAHEIKNPLNFVNNFSGISAELIEELQNTLKGMPLDDKARTEINELTGTLKNNFDKVVHHGRRADAIVKNMLQHSREGTGEHRAIDINALVEESLNLAWHGARAETQGFEIKLRQSFDPSAGEADIFPQDIRRALLNMISNGFYAASRRRAESNGVDYEPSLTASTKSLGDRVEIRIRDNGTGMTPDVKEQMFNPFFTTKPTGEGTGLGLSISHDIIVKQHGGSIEVDTQPGEFTEITVILPRAGALLPERL